MSGGRRFNRRGRGRGAPFAPASILDALPEALRAAGLPDQACRFEIQKVWPKAVGPRIAAKTTPAGFSRGTLVVYVATSVWQNELSLLKPQLLSALNHGLGRELVKDLHIRAGAPQRFEIAPPIEKPEPPRHPLPLPPDWARSSANAIEDPDVRRAFLALTARAAQIEHS